FMFDNIPERFASETADTEEEAQLWLEGDREARRPPELLTRDVVVRAIMREVKAGRGSEHGGAYLNISHRDSDFVKRKLPSMYHQFKELAEVDITAEAMEVGPTLHYYMGGIRVDGQSQMTNVPGLFAAGECSAGLHGANRLGGNSLSDLIVFGARAGLGAKAYLDSLSGARPAVQQEQVHEQMRGVIDFLNREDGENPYVVVDDLQTAMEQHVGIVRDGSELEEGIEKLAVLKERAAKVKAHATSQYNPGWNTCIDLRNMLLSAEATARCALQREESRGAHTRLDFEGEREEGLTFNSVVRLNPDGQIEARKEPRPEPPAELAAIANSTLEDLEGHRA
ncbi:MAG: FAD-binding protein, partial [Planctomycetota bacterium]